MVSSRSRPGPPGPGDVPGSDGPGPGRNGADAGAGADRPVRRPGVLWWCWYALGGGLPGRYRDWVLHDASCPTWRLRHFARAAVQISVITAPLALLLPGPPWVRGCAVLLGLFVGLQYALWFMDGAVDRRVERAGWPRGAAADARRRRTGDRDAADAARYAARWRPGAVKGSGGPHGPDERPSG